MKVSRYKNGEVTTTKIDLTNTDVVPQVIYEMVNDFEEEFSRKPKGIVLGPKEYVALATSLSKEHKYTTDLGVRWPTEFLGLTIHVKEFAGIELLMDHDTAMRRL